jgi:hypothetical protein
MDNNQIKNCTICHVAVSAVEEKKIARGLGRVQLRVQEGEKQRRELCGYFLGKRTQKRLSLCSEAEGLWQRRIGRQLNG